jgi:hypothetical protein
LLSFGSALYTLHTLTAIDLCTLFGFLVGSLSDGSTNNSTTSHTYYSTYIAASPATRDASYGRTENSSKLGTYISALGSIRATTAHQECHT